MNRDEARQLLGRRVLAWTAMNGTYTGTLIEVKPSRPWRGVVLIDGVVRCAAFEFGRRLRRGFRPGERIEVGGSSIREADAPAGSYAEALAAEIRFMEEWAADESRPNRSVPMAALGQLRAVLAADRDYDEARAAVLARWKAASGEMKGAGQ